MISKAGNLVYNITKITDVNSTINTFVWDFKINDQDIKIKDEYKILVMATDDQGCLGTPGDFIIITTGEIETSQKSIIVCFFLKKYSLKINEHIINVIELYCSGCCLLVLLFVL